jgi:hypothetical protein
MFSDDLVQVAAGLLAAARARNIKIASAESCTGGLIAALLTEIAGSSDVFDRGFVTYSNQAKEEMLGVPGAMIRQHGAVSESVARAMAEAPFASPARNWRSLLPGSPVQAAAPMKSPWDWFTSLRRVPAKRRCTANAALATWGAQKCAWPPSRSRWRC